MEDAETLHNIALIGFSFARDLFALSPFIALGIYIFSGIRKSKTERTWHEMQDEKQYQIAMELYEREQAAKLVPTQQPLSTADVSKLY